MRKDFLTCFSCKSENIFLLLQEKIKPPYYKNENERKTLQEDLGYTGVKPHNKYKIINSNIN